MAHQGTTQSSRNNISGNPLDAVTDDKLTQQNMTSSLVTKIGSRPDWLLYTVPGLAFLIGFLLFLLVFKSHNRKTGEYHQRDMKGCSSVRQTRNDDMGPAYLTKADTQSYENVLATIYSNQEGVCFYVPDDGEDYVIPDDEDDAPEISQTANSLNLPDTLTEGESYENMEGLYAHPRKRQNKGQEEDDDYLDPDAAEKHWQGGLHVQEQTDTDSYENMEQQFAAYHQDSDDYISPDADEGHCSKLMSCPQDSWDCPEDTYVSIEDNVVYMEDQEWQ